MKLDDIDCVSAIIGTSLTNIKFIFHFSNCPLFGSFALCVQMAFAPICIVTIVV